MGAGHSEVDGDRWQEWTLEESQVIGDHSGIIEGDVKIGDGLVFQWVDGQPPVGQCLNSAFKMIEMVVPFDDSTIMGIDVKRHGMCGDSFRFPYKIILDPIFGLIWKDSKPRLFYNSDVTAVG